MIKNYLRSTKNLYSCFINGYQVYYSYNTAVGIRYPNNDLYVANNVWSTTTGRHLTWIDGGSKEAKEERIKYNDLLDIFKDKNINKYYN